MFDIIIGRSEKEREEFGKRGTVFLGRQYVQMGQTTSLSNNVYLDVANSHVVFVVGKRGGGKCLHGDTLIRLEDGQEVPIKDLRYESYKIMALNKNAQLIPAKKEGFYEREVNKLLKIKLKSNKEIKLTPEHPLLTLEGWVPANKLGISARIAAENTSAVSSDSFNQITLQLKSDIFWDEIVSIEELHGEFKVYDITVPDYHNFVANGIIVHNSYSMGVIAEGIAALPPEVAQNISVVMLDTMGIYWTMKFPNKQDDDLLRTWGMSPESVDVTIFTPKGYFQSFKDKGIPTDYPFAIRPVELSVSDWLNTFEVQQHDKVGVLITRIISSMKELSVDFSVKDIIQRIRQDEKADQNTKDASENLFAAADTWGIFDKDGTPFDDIVRPGRISVVDVSIYTTLSGSSNVRALVIGLIAQKLFLKRMVARRDEEYESVFSTVKFFAEETKKEMPIVWLLVDEAHEFLPKEGKTAATEPLITILREGRQPGISMILASQQPGKIHTDVMTQSDIVLAHRITAKLDADALGALMQSYMREGLDVQLDNLPREQGAALIFDDTNERMYSMKVRPRFSWHGGSSPSALQKKKELFL